MRYVRHFNQKWYGELITDVEVCYIRMIQRLEGYNQSVLKGEHAIKPSIVKGKDGVTHPFPIAEKIHNIYMWLNGKTDCPPVDIENTLEKIISLLQIDTNTEFAEMVVDFECEEWKGIYVSAFHSAAIAALKLFNNKPVNASEIALLVHLSAPAVLKQIKENKLQADKQDNKWCIEPEAAKKWISLYNDNEEEVEFDEDWYVIDFESVG